MLHLVSLLTENYVIRARPFLESLCRLTGIECHVVGLGYDPEPLRATFLKINPYGTRVFSAHTMPRHWSESSCGIMQQGRWLDALPDVRDDDVYLLTDADIIVQRDFTPEERQLFETCGEDEFLAGWNACEGDTLEYEADRIDLAVGEDTFGDWDIPCFNTGVLAMRGRSWKRLRDLYESRCERFYRLTSHRSRGQWLICWCLHRLELRAKILPLSVHAHGHFSMPPGVFIHNNIAEYQGQSILFRHAM